ALRGRGFPIGANWSSANARMQRANNLTGPGQLGRGHQSATSTRSASHDTLRVQVRQGGTEIGLEHGHAQGGLSQDRRRPRHGGVASFPDLRPTDVGYRLGELYRADLRATPGVTWIMRAGVPRRTAAGEVSGTERPGH